MAQVFPRWSASVKHLAPLLLLVCVGCLSPSPGKVGDPASTAAGAVSVKELGEALALYVAGENCEDTDEFWKVAKSAAENCGLSATVLDKLGTVESNRDFDAALRDEFASKCRSLK